MRYIKLLLLLALSFSSFAIAAQEYQPGEVWRYKARPGEEKSTIHILGKESIPGAGTVYFIAIDGAVMGSVLRGERVETYIPFVPVTAAVLIKGLTTKMPEDKMIPNFADSLDFWKQSFEKGQGGIFTVPLVTIIAYIERSMGGSE